MNSMRLLILLTFVLYETQRAESTLTYLKSMIKKHLHATPEPSAPNIGCQHVEYGANGEAVADWNRQLRLNEKPMMIEIDEQGNVGSVNVEEQPKQNENPIVLEIDDKGGVKSINAEEVTVQNEHRILIEIDDDGNVSSYKAEEDSKETENPIIVEIDDQGKIVRVITKTNPEKLQTADENTSWLLGEKPSENQTEGDGGKLHSVFESIKEKIVAKINAIKSKLHLKKEVVEEKPVTENVQDSEYNLEEKNNDYVLPSVASILPVSTAEPVVVVTAKPMPTAGVPVTAGSPWTTAGVPVTAGSPWTTAGVPVTAGSPWTTTGTPVTAGAPFATGVPVTAARPAYDGYGPLQEQLQVISIPGRRRVPFPVRTVYYSPMPYPLRWYGQPQYAAVQNAFATKPQPTIENTPYYVAPVAYRNQNFGYAPPAQPAFVAPASPQWIRYAPEDGPKYVRPAPTALSVPVTPARTSAVPELPSTMRPIAVYSTDATSVSPPSTRPAQEPVAVAEDDWNRLVQDNASVLSGIEGSDYPSRGDVPSYAGGPEGSENGYLLMERRNVEDDVAVEKNAKLETSASTVAPTTRSKSEKKPTNSKSEKKPTDSKSEKKLTDPKLA